MLQDAKARKLEVSPISLLFLSLNIHCIFDLLHLSLQDIFCTARCPQMFSLKVQIINILDSEGHM